MLCATLPLRDMLNQRTIWDGISLSAFVLVVLEILLCQLHCVTCFGSQLLIQINTFSRSCSAITTLVVLTQLQCHYSFVRPIKHICLFYCFPRYSTTGTHGMDRSPTALVYQLPRVASNTPGPELPQEAPSRQGCSGLYGQHSNLCVYQPAMRLRFYHTSQLPRHLFFWSQKHLRSLPAIHIPGVFNQATNELSRAALPGKWRLHPQAVQLIGIGSEWLR